MEKKPEVKKGDWPPPVMTTRWDEWAPNPNQLRWLPFKLPGNDEVCAHLNLALGSCSSPRPLPYFIANYLFHGTNIGRPPFVVL